MRRHVSSLSGWTGWGPSISQGLGSGKLDSDRVSNSLINSCSAGADVPAPSAGGMDAGSRSFVHAACPFCLPQLFDGDLDVVPEVKLCALHEGHPLADVFNQPVARRAQGGPSHSKIRPVRGLLTNGGAS